MEDSQEEEISHEVPQETVQTLGESTTEMPLGTDNNITPSSN